MAQHQVLETQKNPLTTQVTPWEVKGEIDYDKLIVEFGCQPVDQALLVRMEKLIEGPVHRFLRRGIFFSHRDLDLLLDHHQASLPFYLYTGRGPSSESMHVGHMIPFLFTLWLQRTFGVPLVIQMTDDEKFLFRPELSLEDTRHMCQENIKDIIAFGFDPELTFIFSDFEYVGTMYPTICRIQKHLNLSTVRSTFGFNETANIGKISFVAIQAAPSFPSSFPDILFRSTPSANQNQDQDQNPIPSQDDDDLHSSSLTDRQRKKELRKKQKEEKQKSRQQRLASGKTQHSQSPSPSPSDKWRCLIPCAIDQDPYFRLTRDVAHKLGPQGHKPALLHSKFFPALAGVDQKMSSSCPDSTIFLTDTREMIRRKIHRKAFSGGRDTWAEQQIRGVDLSVDIPFLWLNFFLEDDHELERLRQDYGQGKIKTSEVKDLLVNTLSDLIEDHQKRRQEVTPEMVLRFTRPHFIGGFNDE